MACALLFNIRYWLSHQSAVDGLLTRTCEKWTLDVAGVCYFGCLMIAPGNDRGQSTLNEPLVSIETLSAVKFEEQYHSAKIVCFTNIPAILLFSAQTESQFNLGLEYYMNIVMA